MKSGQKVIIDRWGGDKPLLGHVRQIEPFGFTKVSALGIEEQRVNVIVDFDSPLAERYRLGHGFQLDTRVVLWESDDVLTVPLTALFRIGKDWAVFVEESARAKHRIVSIGRSNGLVSEVQDGLSPGDRVIVHPSNQVADGVRVSET
jgi:HlyD family secretion protein